MIGEALMGFGFLLITGMMAYYLYIFADMLSKLYKYDNALSLLKYELLKRKAQKKYGIDIADLEKTWFAKRKEKSLEQKIDEDLDGFTEKPRKASPSA